MEYRICIKDLVSNEGGNKHYALINGSYLQIDSSTYTTGSETFFTLDIYGDDVLYIEPLVGDFHRVEIHEFIRSGFTLENVVLYITENDGAITWNIELE